MGWGNGISIGWPNASSQGGTPTVYELTIINCPGDPQIVFSLSSVFVPNIYVYTDALLTTPFLTEVTWGVDGGATVYPIDSNGKVIDTPSSCG